jgi:glycosyltransferase involved in cell wall biosynthesis
VLNIRYSRELKNASEAAMNSKITQSKVQMGRRYRQFCDLWKVEGSKGITDRARRVVADKIAPKEAILPVRRADIIAADLSRPFQPEVPKIAPGQPLLANWVTTPPGPGSGGHTTLFRIIRYLEAHGYRNRVYFYDVYRGDHSYYESFVRSYYDFHGSVANVDDGMADATVVIATGWPTAYPVFNARCTGKRFYFVQDFEPYFYPVGTISLLAESTYRMGFHGISIGECYAQKIRKEFGMTVDTFKYGCDISRYRRLAGHRRSGVVFYARRETARRGVELGLMALEVFAARRPDITIHIYGDKIGRLPFAFMDHGHITPDEINNIYNQCYAGLSLSFTNVSLVALEMLAAGCIPVVNDTPQVRTDLKNPFVRYASAYPQALAAEFEALADMADFELLSQAAAESVHSTSWDEAGAAVDAILRRSLTMAANEVPLEASNVSR